MAMGCWGEDSDPLRLKVSRHRIEAGPKPGLSVFGPFKGLRNTSVETHLVISPSTIGSTTNRTIFLFRVEGTALDWRNLRAWRIQGAIPIHEITRTNTKLESC